MGAHRRTEPATTEQQQPRWRTRGLGTLGACMISPSSAYVLLRAGAGGTRGHTRTWMNPLASRAARGISCCSRLLQAVTGCSRLLRRLGGERGACAVRCRTWVVGTLGTCVISPSSAYVLPWACVTRNRRMTRGRRTAERGTRRTGAHLTPPHTAHAAHSTRGGFTHTHTHTTQRQRQRDTHTRACAHKAKVSIRVSVLVR